MHIDRNRRRTRPLVEEMDSTMLARIEGKRHDLTKILSTSGALRRIKKEAYFQFIYHTAGIEGNTLSLAQTRMILETRQSVGGTVCYSPQTFLSSHITVYLHFNTSTCKHTSVYSLSIFHQLANFYFIVPVSAMFCSC